MKKLLALFLAAVMIFSLAACAATETPAETPSDSTAPADSAAPADSTSEYVPHKIGVIYYGIDDPFCAEVYRTINRAGELLNCEIVWAIGSLDPNDQITDAQNLIAAGVEGIVCIPLGEIATQKIMQLCEQEGVYFSITLRQVDDPEIREEVYYSDYWVGNVNEDNYDQGRVIIEQLYKEGCRKIGLLLGVGEQSYEVARNQAFYETAEELGMEVLAVSTPIIGTTDATAATENFITSYPEMDGIAVCCGATGQGEQIIATVDRLGKTDQVKIAICDTFTGMAEAFESHSVHCCAGGFSADTLFSFMWLYNAVDGYPLTTEKAVSLTQNTLYITNAEECLEFDTYVDNEAYHVYKDEDILSMVRRTNPDFDIEAMQEYMSLYSLDWIKGNLEEAK